MSHVAIVGARAPVVRGRIGDVPFVSTLVTDIEASARAQLFQQLANFQALPQRVARVIAQLGALQLATPARSVDESTAIAAAQQSASQAQSQWADANTTVMRAVQELGTIGAGADLGATARDLAGALAGMALADNLTSSLEGDARSLIVQSPSLTDAQRAQLLAMGAASTWDLWTVLKWGGLAYAAYRLLRGSV